MKRSKKAGGQKKPVYQETITVGEVKSMDESIKKSEMSAMDKFDYQKLVYPFASGLLSCTYEEQSEELIFHYDTAGMKNINEIKEEEKEKKYQLLINFAQLWNTFLEYSISLSPENLYYDENYLIYAKRRDIYGRGKKADEDEFLIAYKSMICGFLGNRYDVAQIQESGLSILKDEKGFEDIFECESPQRLVSFLRQKKSEYIRKRREFLREVPKRSYNIWRLATLLFVILAVGGGGYSVYAGKFEIPKQKAVITANQSYIGNDYVSCIDSLRGMEPEQMDQNTKYILAVSYANSESFRKEEIQTIVSKLGPGSNEKELNYWVYLGRLDIERAEDIALALSDDKLLIYAYMKESDLLESNTDITGTEKKERLDKLEQEITRLGKKYEEVENE